MTTANKNDLTVLLMLKDRVPFTWRWMDYMNSISFPYKIFIADGGADEKVPEVLGKKSNYPNIDYEYVRYPYDQTYQEYYVKIADAATRIKTPFISISDNDDFCVPFGLASAVAFMKEHPDYSACRGEVDGILLNPRARKGQRNVLYGRSKWLNKLYAGKSNDCDNQVARVKMQLNKYDPTFYDVHRTDQLKACFKVLRDINPKNIYLAELLTSLLTVAKGKVERLKCLHYVRQCNTPETSSLTESQKYDFFDRLLLSSWSEDFTKTVEAVAQELAVAGLSRDETIDLIKAGYKVFVAPNVIWSLQPQRRSGVRLLLNKIIDKARLLLPEIGLKRLAGGDREAITAIRSYLKNHA